VNAASTRVGELLVVLRDKGVKFRLEEPLARYTTMGIGGPAEVIAFPASTAELVTVTELASSTSVPTRLLGGGSNLLVSDQGVRGLVIHVGAMKVMGFLPGAKVEVEAGVSFPALVRAAAARGLRGLEGGVGIPGSLGGVLAMNAGAYGFAVGDWVEKVTVVTARGERRELSRSEIDFHYRRTSLGADVAVAGCVLALSEDDPRAIWADLDRNMGHRKATQPVGVKSAGCIFKNPDGDSAGRLIDSLGLKGLRVGGAWVSEVHGNFIVQGGGATSADVLAVIDTLKDRVRRETGVELEEEVKQWT